MSADATSPSRERSLESSQISPSLDSHPSTFSNTPIEAHVSPNTRTPIPSASPRTPPPRELSSSSSSSVNSNLSSPTYSKYTSSFIFSSTAQHSISTPTLYSISGDEMSSDAIEFSIHSPKNVSHSSGSLPRSNRNNPPVTRAKVGGIKVDNRSDDDDDEDEDVDSYPRHARSIGRHQFIGLRKRSRDEGSANRGERKKKRRRYDYAETSESGKSSSYGIGVPQEYRAEVDRVFFEILESLCSNLATDANGKPMLQTSMAVKMQRLDEPPKFRLFTFHARAFTEAFRKELAQQGYPAEKIPKKMTRRYLRDQTYISRVDELGERAKSGTNYIWSINAKKKPEGGWVFGSFHRRLIGTPCDVAYVGLRWAWAPRIWDPHGSRWKPTFTSLNHPSWLAWKDGRLSGVPPPEAESCDITIEARIVEGNREECLTQTVHLNIIPILMNGEIYRMLAMRS